jgi:hypothetical protein
MAGLQGKSCEGPGSAPFGGSDGLVCFSRREKYCHNGGIAFAHHHGVGLPGGSTTAIMAPSGGPLKAAVCRGKAAESGVRAFWGPEWTCLPATARDPTPAAPLKRSLDVH